MCSRRRSTPGIKPARSTTRPTASTSGTAPGRARSGNSSRPTSTRSHVGRLGTQQDLVAQRRPSRRRTPHLDLLPTGRWNHADPAREHVTAEDGHRHDPHEGQPCTLERLSASRGSRPLSSLCVNPAVTVRDGDYLRLAFMPGVVSRNAVTHEPPVGYRLMHFRPTPPLAIRGRLRPHIVYAGGAGIRSAELGLLRRQGDGRCRQGPGMCRRGWPC